MGTFPCGSCPTTARVQRPTPPRTHRPVRRQPSPGRHRPVHLDALPPRPAALLARLRSHGTVDAVGIEGTGFDGAALTEHLPAAGVRVVDVTGPNCAARRADGKSDQLDAEQAARVVLAATATAV